MGLFSWIQSQADSSTQAPPMPNFLSGSSPVVQAAIEELKVWDGVAVEREGSDHFECSVVAASSTPAHLVFSHLTHEVEQDQLSAAAAACQV